MENEGLGIYSPDKRWYAEISAHRGANVTKLQYQGKDVLVPLESQKQWENDPFVQGSPLLLPANRTAGGKFTYLGREYSLPVNDKKKLANLHGSLYRQTFSVLQTEEDRVVLRYENRGEIYPFPFRITAAYTLENSGFKQEFTLQNRGETGMPYTFALHTTFCGPAYFRVPLDLVEEKDKNHIPTGRYLPLNEKEQQYVSGCSPDKKAISGYYKAGGHIAVIGEYIYTVSEQFDHFVLFNVGGNAGYLCVEPQVGAVNGLNLPQGCRVLPAGETDRLQVSIERIL